MKLLDESSLEAYPSGTSFNLDLIETVLIDLNQNNCCCQSNIFDEIFSMHENQDNEISSGDMSCQHDTHICEKSSHDLKSFEDTKSEVNFEESAFRISEFKKSSRSEFVHSTFDLRLDAVNYFMADLRSADLKLSQIESITSSCILPFDKMRKEEAITAYKLKIKKRSKYKGKYQNRCYAAEKKLRIRGRFVKVQNVQVSEETHIHSTIEGTGVNYAK